MSNKNGQLVTFDEAKPSMKQHTSPCKDCPWSRKSIPGWLGNMSVDEWLLAAHGEALIDCHTISNQQCAGSAIYRANVCKSTRRDDVIKLPADTKKVFSFGEFKKHHEKELDK